MAAVMNKVYVFYYSSGSSGYSFVAFAADGTCLSFWVSESEEVGRTAARSPEKMAKYEKYYSAGFELVWQGGPINPETMAARKPGSGGSIEFIEGQLYNEFLRVLTC
jgi:hypothetical protein